MDAHILWLKQTDEAVQKGIHRMRWVSGQCLRTIRNSGITLGNDRLGRAIETGENVGVRKAEWTD